eukprot:6186454-Pleurochrysis_carterae.AAC.1
MACTEKEGGLVDLALADEYMDKTCAGHVQTPSHPSSIATVCVTKLQLRSVPGIFFVRSQPKRENQGQWECYQFAFNCNDTAHYAKTPSHRTEALRCFGRRRARFTSIALFGTAPTMSSIFQAMATLALILAVQYLYSSSQLAGCCGLRSNTSNQTTMSKESERHPRTPRVQRLQRLAPTLRCRVAASPCAADALPRGRWRDAVVQAHTRGQLSPRAHVLAMEHRRDLRCKRLRRRGAA